VHRVFGFAPAKMPTKLVHLSSITGPREPAPLPVRFRYVHPSSLRPSHPMALQLQMPR
jgi:hypothetical protein